MCATQYAFPTSLELDATDLNQDFVMVTCQAVADSMCCLRFAAPTSWHAVQMADATPSPNRPMVTLARCDQPDGFADIEVLVQLIPRDMHPADLLECFLSERGFDILNVRRQTDAGGTAGDILAQGMVDGQPRIIRAVTVKDADRVFYLICSSDPERYEALARTFLVAIQTFGLLEPTGQPYAEPMVLIRLDHPVAVSCVVPARWDRRQDPSPPPGGQIISLAHVQGKRIVGRIDVMVLPQDLASSAQRVAEDLMEAVAASGMRIETPEVVPVQNVPDGFDAAWDVTSTGQDHEGRDIEMKVQLLRNPSAWLVVTFIGLSHDEDTLAHLANRKTLDTLLATLHLEGLST